MARFRLPKRERPAPAPDYRLGRAFDPTAIADGWPRVILTAAPADGQPTAGRLPVHVDSFNLSEDPAVRTQQVLQLLSAAFTVLTGGSVQHVREQE